MFKKLLNGILCAVMMFSLAACSTTQDSSDSGAIVEDPTGTNEEITNLEDGAIIVGDNYESENANVEMQEAEKAKLEALKQDATIYFGFDSESIDNNYVALLQAHAEFLRNNPNIKVIIEGHTDERGTPEYNVALGERRTRSVAQYLMNLGVSVDQLSIVSYGEEKPLDSGHSESSWSKNRRAVIVY
jgi:peptidoglycan-associated lipoprotein